MSDQSHRDNLYFVDEKAYNCPFCNRRHLLYSVSKPTEFDWSKNRKCYVYFARCMDCKHTSMHLAHERVEVELAFSGLSHYSYRFVLPEDFDEKAGLDPYFFYSQPTSFLVLDPSIPAILRDLLSEAEGCLKSNFLTGAAACARKLVYELIEDRNATGNDYKAKLKSLEGLLPEAAQDYVGPLNTIQKLTSQKVHENSNKAWRSAHMRVILAALRELLHEVYVVPSRRSEAKQRFYRLSQDLAQPNEGAKEN